MRQSPLLLRPAEIPDLAKGAEWFTENRPGDILLYGHYGSHEDVVVDLRARGWKVMRYVQLLTANARAANWAIGSLERFLWDLFDSNDWWLRDRRGELVLFRWFARGPIYNLGRLDEEHAQLIADRIQSGNIVDRYWELDQSWLGLYRWMFLNRSTQIRNLADYSHVNYLRGFQLIHSAMGWPLMGADLIVNGDWDLDKQGWRVMYENADTGRHYRYLWKTVDRWSKRPGSILTVNGAPRLSHIRRLVERLWMRRGGILFCENQQTADYAWGVKNGLT